MNWLKKNYDVIVAIVLIITFFIVSIIDPLNRGIAMVFFCLIPPVFINLLLQKLIKLKVVLQIIYFIIGFVFYYQNIITEPYFRSVIIK